MQSVFANKPLVGLTGGIGSGKTIIGKIFELLGVPVYYADNKAKDLLDTSGEIIDKIKAAFGEDAYLPNGKLDRKRMAAKVFSNPEKLALLNGIVHPALRDDFQKWAETQRRDAYLVKEAAILVESGAYKEMNLIISVEASKELRTFRVMERDGISMEEVLKRMKAQMKDEERRRYAAYVINNNGDELVIPQVLNIHEDIIRKTGS